MTRAARTAAIGGKPPRIYLALGASNFTLDRAGAWTPPPNLTEWNWVGANKTVTATGTVTIASPGVWTVNGHGGANGDRVFLTTSGAVPTGYTVNTAYYLTGVSANAFSLAATPGGAAIATSGSQSGTHTVHFFRTGGSTSSEALQSFAGSAFTAFDGTQLNCVVEFARLQALEEPDRQHRIIRLSRGGLHLAQWMSGAAAYPPDFNMWTVVLNNVAAALTAAGATRIDALLWGGVADADPAVTGETIDLASRFETFMAQLYAQSWCPRQTPILVCSLTSGNLSTADHWNDNNDVSQLIVHADPANRQYVHLPDMPASFWTDGNVHPTFGGMQIVGQMMSNAYRRGFRRPLVPRMPWQTLASGITWTGTAAPSGTANNAYTWVKIGPLVIVQFRLSYASAGTDVTALSVTKPADMPTPAPPKGWAAGESLMNGKGGMATTLNGTITPGRMTIMESSGVYSFNWLMASGGWRLATGSFTYFADE